MEITNNTIRNTGISAATLAAAYLAIGAIFAHAEAAPSINATIRNSSEGTITSALVGASVHSVVQVASSTASTTPQGTVDFNVYSNTSCSGTPATQPNVALSGGFATSSVSVVPAGGLSYKVHYDGDVNNIAADSACMPLTATSNTAVISLGLSATTITAGQSVQGIAALSGVTSNASGTVAYSVFTNSSCTTPFGGAGNVSVNNGSIPNSPPFQFLSPGTYYWQAAYSGDQNNNAATSSCATGVLTVHAINKNSPTIGTSLSTSSIQVGTSVHDSASLSGATGTASGTVMYRIYSDSACTNLYAQAGTRTVTNASVPNSDNVQFNSAGTYYWQAAYSGDSNNSAATSSCTSEILSVANHGGTTSAGNGTLSGEVFNDANDNGVMDAGETGLPGFTVHLYVGTNFNNFGYFPVYKTAITDANGNYSFTNLPDGIYSVEQVLKNGWKQTTDDYTSVTVSGGQGQSGLNFGDVAGSNGKERGHGTEKHNHGKHKGHNKDSDNGDDDNGNAASSTHQWMFDANISGNNGLHLGWFIGRGNKHHDD